MIILSMGCAMNKKKVMEELRKKAGLTLTNDMMIGDEMNFSALAMLGHMIFLLPDSEFTASGKRMLTIYRNSLGGARNIKEFGPNGTVAGKERTIILRKWHRKLAGYHPAELAALVYPFIPELFVRKASISSRIVRFMVRLISSPFRAVAAAPWVLYKIASSRVLTILMVSAIYVASASYLGPMANEYLESKSVPMIFPETAMAAATGLANIVSFVVVNLVAAFRAIRNFYMQS